VSDDAFTTIKKLLVPYATHFTLSDDTDEAYVLNEELPHSRTMFGYLSRSRGGARLVFYPLQVFPELREALPPVLAPILKSKCILSFKTISAAARAALAKTFAAGFKRVAAQRKLNPTRGYYRKLDVDETRAAIMALVGEPARPGVTVTRRKTDIAVTLPPRTKVPALLAAKQARPGTLKLKTITPAEHDALAKLLRA
jgi:hypothetical protein